MPRPNIILEPVKTYNLLLPIRVYDTLGKKAHDRRVSVAALIREAVENWIRDNA